MEDNAELTVAIIKALVKEDKVVAFPEYIHGISSFDNVFTRIGPSATSLIIQLFLFLVLMFYAFNKRFGQPLEEKVPTPGTADFANASAEMLKSAGATDLVLETTLQITTNARAHLRDPQRPSPKREDWAIARFRSSLFRGRVSQGAYQAQQKRDYPIIERFRAGGKQALTLHARRPYHDRGPSMFSP